MLGSASPLKPSVVILKRSASLLILLVACFSKAVRASSLDIPSPLSETRIKPLPAFIISTNTSVAFASMEFSTNSFTTDAGLSTTSPAAILLISVSGRIFILGDINAPT